MKQMIFGICMLLSLGAVSQTQLTVKEQLKERIKKSADDFELKFDNYTLKLLEYADCVAAETQSCAAADAALTQAENDLFDNYADIDGELAERSFYQQLCHVIGSIGYYDCTSRIRGVRSAVCLQDFRSFMATCYSLIPH